MLAGRGDGGMGWGKGVVKKRSISRVGRQGCVGMKRVGEEKFRWGEEGGVGTGNRSLCLFEGL